MPTSVTLVFQMTSRHQDSKFKQAQKRLRFCPVTFTLTRFVPSFVNTTAMRMMLTLLMVLNDLGLFIFLLILSLTSQCVILGLDSRTSQSEKYLLLTFILLKLTAMILWVHWDLVASLLSLS